jgi:hypothetical protein
MESKRSAVAFTDLLARAAGLRIGVRAGQTVTRDHAVRLIRSFGRSMGVEGAGLNKNDTGGLLLGEGELFFEYHRALFTMEEPSLQCSALIYRFRDEPRDGLIDAFKAEEAGGTPTGGGTIEYDSATKGLFLTRAYVRTVDEKAFREDMTRLVRAGRRWGNEVLARVSQRFFRPVSATGTK